MDMNQLKPWGKNLWPHKYGVFIVFFLWSTPKAIVINLDKEEEEFYTSSSLYPCDGSDIDEDDESDVEGKYDFSIIVK